MGVSVSSEAFVAPHYFHTEYVEGGRVDTWGVSGKPIAQFDSRTRNLYFDIKTIFGLEPERWAPSSIGEAVFEILGGFPHDAMIRPFEMRFRGDSRFMTPNEFGAYATKLTLDQIERGVPVSHPDLEVRTPLGSTLVGKVNNYRMIGLDSAYFPKAFGSRSGGGIQSD